MFAARTNISHKLGNNAVRKVGTHQVLEGRALIQQGSKRIASLCLAWTNTHSKNLKYAQSRQGRVTQRLNDRRAGTSPHKSRAQQTGASCTWYAIPQLNSRTAYRATQQRRQKVSQSSVQGHLPPLPLPHGPAPPSKDTQPVTVATTNVG